MLKIKNWAKFQHFKDRRPPWIKLYRGILDDKKWFDLKGEDAKILVMLWLIASEDDGYLPDVGDLAFRLRKSEKEMESTIKRLNHWFELGDITEISPDFDGDTPETETEGETEKEKDTLVEVFEHYTKTFKKNSTYKLTPPRISLIKKALKRGHSKDDLLQAISKMSIDEWEGRVKFNDLRYALGESKGEDYVAKWASYEPKKPQPSKMSKTGILTKEDFKNESNVRDL